MESNYNLRSGNKNIRRTEQTRYLAEHTLLKLADFADDLHDYIQLPPEQRTATGTTAATKDSRRIIEALVGGGRNWITFLEGSKNRRYNDVFANDFNFTLQKGINPDLYKRATRLLSHPTNERRRHGSPNWV